MRLTMTHVQFWQRHQRQPKWVMEVMDKSSARLSPSFRPAKYEAIHSVINSHAGLSLSDTREQQSLMVLLKLARRNGYTTDVKMRPRKGTLRAYLQHLAEHGSTASRKIWARRWLRRIEEALPKEVQGGKDAVVQG